MVALRHPASPTPSSLSIDDLFQRVRDGDEEAFALLHQRLQRQIFNHINQMLQDDAHSEDLTQDTFAKLWSYRDRFRDDTNVVALLHRMAHNKALDVVRRRQRLRFQSYDPGHHEALLPATPDPARVVEADETRGQVQKALDALPPRDRLLMIHFYFDDQSLEETGDRLGMSRTATKSALFRARARFRDLYGRAAAGAAPATSRPPFDLTRLAPTTRRFFLEWVAGANIRLLQTRHQLSRYRVQQIIRECRATLGLPHESQQDLYLLCRSYRVTLPPSPARKRWVMPGAPLRPLEGQVYQLHRAGLSQRQIGNRLGIHDNTAGALLRIARTKLDQRFEAAEYDPLTTNQREALVQWSAGRSRSQIADQMRRRGSTIQQRLAAGRQRIAALLGCDWTTLDRPAVAAWLAEHPTSRYQGRSRRDRQDICGQAQHAARQAYVPTDAERQAMRLALAGPYRLVAGVTRQRLQLIKEHMCFNQMLPTHEWRTAFERYLADHPQQEDTNG